MNKKGILILFFIVGVALIEACSCFTSCGCKGAPDAPDYFDFKEMTVTPKQGIGTETLRLIFKPDSVTFLACVEKGFTGFGLLPAAYACSPEEPGMQGLKFPITKINITADRPFRDSLPAGVSLNTLFSMTTDPYSPSPDGFLMQSQLASLSMVESIPPFSGGDYSEFYLVTDATPEDSSTPFQFTITFTKSDGSEVSVTTAPISF